jgi:hypothetical protein
LFNKKGFYKVITELIDSITQNPKRTGSFDDKSEEGELKVLFVDTAGRYTI